MKTKKRQKEYLLSTQDASVVLNCSRNQILKLIKMGRLEGVRHDRNSRNSKYFVRSGSLRKFLIASCVKKRRKKI